MKFIQGQNRNQIALFPVSLDESIDSKNNIPIDYKVTNENDSKAMGQFPWYHLRARLPIIITITRTSDTTGKRIPTLVLRGRFCEPTDHGISSYPAPAESAGLNSIKTKACKNCPSHSKCTRSKDCRRNCGTPITKQLNSVSLRKYLHHDSF